MLDTNTRINDHVIWLPRGQTVAAQVPYTKRKQEWIVASVVSWNEDELTYVVKDEFPENKKMKSWTIPYHKVIRFPRDLKDTLSPGDRVLSLWYIPDTEEWSSMFYEATIVNADEVDKTSTILLRFNGDDEVYEIDSMKIVKKPKRRSKVPKRAFSAANGSLSPLPSPPSDVYDDSRHQRSASPPEQPASKKQRVKMEMEDYQPSATRSGVETSPFSPTSSASSTSISSATSSSPYFKSIGGAPGASSAVTSGASGSRERSPEREQQHQSSHSAPVSAAVFNSRYQFCGVLGKKMKRMGAILNERSKVSNT